jgi:hypothetical protein
MKRTFILAHREARNRAIVAIKEAPDGVAVTLSEPRRTSAENSLLHALIGDISEEHKWAGEYRDAETWKRLMVAAWCRVRGEPVQLLPAIDGEGFDMIPARTSALSKAECADLITFIQTFTSKHSRGKA